MAIDDEDRDTGVVRVSLVGHLAELRRRIIICVVAVTCTGIFAFFLYNPVLHFLRQPYCEAIRSRGLRNSGVGCNLVITDPLEGFTTRLKVTGYLAIFFASPVLLCPLWRFITPGLRQRQERYASP